MLGLAVIFIADIYRVWRINRVVIFVIMNLAE